MSETPEGTAVTARDPQILKHIRHWLWTYMTHISICGHVCYNTCWVYFAVLISKIYF